MEIFSPALFSFSRKANSFLTRIHCLADYVLYTDWESRLSSSSPCQAPKLPPGESGVRAPTAGDMGTILFTAVTSPQRPCLFSPFPMYSTCLRILPHIVEFSASSCCLQSSFCFLPSKICGNFYLPCFLSYLCSYREIQRSYRWYRCGFRYSHFGFPLETEDINVYSLPIT